MSVIVGIACCLALYIYWGMGTSHLSPQTIIEPARHAVESANARSIESIGTDGVVRFEASSQKRPLISEISYRDLSLNDALQSSQTIGIKAQYQIENLKRYFLPGDANFLKYESNLGDLAANGDSFVGVSPFQQQFSNRENTSIALGEPLRAYFGLLHAHTSDSDGRFSPADAFEMGRQVAGLDFMAVTDHSDFWPLTQQKYFRDVVALARQVSTKNFVAFGGFEYSSLWLGHYVVLESQDYHSTYQDKNLEDFYNWLAQNDALVAFAHPGFHTYRARQDLGRLRFDKRLYDKMIGMEVVHMNQFRKALKGFSKTKSFFDDAMISGWNLGPLASQDNHKANWGIQDATRIAVLAPQLSRESIVDALRHRRFYATMTPNLQMSVNLSTVNGWVQMGATVQRDMIAENKVLVVVRYAQPDDTLFPKRFEVVVNGVVEGVKHFYSQPGRWEATFPTAILPILQNPWTPSETAIGRAGEFRFWLPLPSRYKPGSLYFYIRLYEAQDGSLYTQSAPITISNLKN